MSCWTINVNSKAKWTNHIAVAVRDTIYFFGNFTPFNNNSEENIGPGDVQVFQTDTYQWSVLKNHNFSQIIDIPPRELPWWSSAVVSNDLVYIFGNVNEQENALFCFDTNSHLWSKPVVSGMISTIAQRGGNSTCVINDSVYIFGGFDLDMLQASQGVYKLDLKSFKWAHVPTKGAPPMPRVGHSATTINGCMFIFGGRRNDGPPYFNEIVYNDLVYLDTQTMTWITPEVTGLYRPVGRAHHVAVCYKGQLLVFGGLTETYNDLWRYDPDSRCWSLMVTKGNVPCPRFIKQSCFLIKDRVFLYGGCDASPLPDSVTTCTYHYDIHSLDLAPSLKTLSILAVLEHKLDQKGLLVTIRSDIKLINSEEIQQSGNNGE